MNTMRTAAALATTLIASALASCSSGPGAADGGDGGGAVTLEIISPQNNTVVPTAGPITVLFGVVNYTLEGPALCSAGMSHCGQAQLTVDGGSCASGNMTGTEVSFDVDLSTCSGGTLANGSSHSVTVVLLDGTGNPIAGATATSNFTVMTM